MTLVWTQEPSGDWIAIGGGGRHYRYHPLATLRVYTELHERDRRVLMTAMNSGFYDPEVYEARAQAHEDAQELSA